MRLGGRGGRRAPPATPGPATCCPCRRRWPSAAPAQCARRPRATGSTRAASSPTSWRPSSRCSRSTASPGAAYEPDGGFADVHAARSAPGSRPRRARAGAAPRHARRGHRDRRRRRARVRTDRGTIATAPWCSRRARGARELAARWALDLPLALRRLQVALLRQPPGRPAALGRGLRRRHERRRAPGRRPRLLRVAYHGQEEVAHARRLRRARRRGLRGGGARRAGERYPALADAEWVRGWAGAYDHTPDWHPLLGAGARRRRPVAGARLVGPRLQARRRPSAASRRTSCWAASRRSTSRSSPPTASPAAQPMPLAYGPGARA